MGSWLKSYGQNSRDHKTSLGFGGSHYYRHIPRNVKAVPAWLHGCAQNQARCLVPGAAPKIPLCKILDGTLYRAGIMNSQISLLSQSRVSKFWICISLKTLPRGFLIRLLLLLYLADGRAMPLELLLVRGWETPAVNATVSRNLKAGF